MTDEAWRSSKLADLVAEAVGGLWGSPPDSEDPNETDVFVLRGADFRNWDERRALDAVHRRIPIRSLERRLLNPGDLVLEVSGGGPSQPVGRVLMIDDRAVQEMSGPLICSNFCRKLRLKTGANPLFVKRQLDWLYASGHMSKFQRSTTNIRNLQVDQFLDATAILLPDSEAQAEIAAVLDVLGTKQTVAASYIGTARGTIERIRQAVLAAACSGRLTDDWRETHPDVSSEELLQRVAERRDALVGPRAKPPSPIASQDLRSIPTSWRWASVDSLSLRVVDGVHKTPTYRETGIPFVTVRNLTAGPGLSLEGARFISEEDHARFCMRAKPERGDLLISKDGTIGVTRAVRTDQPFSIFVSVALIKPVFQTMTDYLELALSSPPVQEQMIGVGSGLQHLVLRDLKADAVPIPPPEEQIEIVRRVSSLLDTAHRVGDRLESAHRRLKSSQTALLAKAFRGELAASEVAD